MQPIKGVGRADVLEIAPGVPLEIGDGEVFHLTAEPPYETDMTAVPDFYRQLDAYRQPGHDRRADEQREERRRRASTP